MITLRQIQKADFKRVNQIFRDAFGVESTVPTEYIANLCRTDPEGCKTCMVFESQAGEWPPAMENLFIWPWWS